MKGKDSVLLSYLRRQKSEKHNNIFDPPIDNPSRGTMTS